MKAVVSEFHFTVQGRSHDEVHEKMNALALAILNETGGAPWIMVDDDIKRLQAQQYVIADDQGFAYQGLRSYIFQGPALAGPGVPSHDGVRTQDGVE